METLWSFDNSWLISFAVDYAKVPFSRPGPLDILGNCQQTFWPLERWNLGIPSGLPSTKNIQKPGTNHSNCCNNFQKSQWLHPTFAENSRRKPTLECLKHPSFSRKIHENPASCWDDPDLWANYNDRFPPVGHPKWWFSKGIHPKSPKHSGLEIIVSFAQKCMSFSFTSRVDKSTLSVYTWMCFPPRFNE